MVGWIKKKRDGWMDRKKQMDGRIEEKKYLKKMDGWKDKKKEKIDGWLKISGKKWLVGRIKNMKKQMDGWMAKKIYGKKYGWLDG